MIYFEEDDLKSLIPDYVNSMYWNIFKEYRQSEEYRKKTIYEKFEYVICKFGAEAFEEFLVSRAKHWMEE